MSDIRPTVDRSKASVTVKVKFLDAPAGVLPDMAAKVSFLTQALDDAELKAAPKLVAPADAVVDRSGRKVVFTVDEEHAPRGAGAGQGAVGRHVVELTAGPPPGRAWCAIRPRAARRLSVKEKKSER